MIGCVVGMGSRELLLPAMPWSATFLEIAFWGVVGVGGLVLLVLLVEFVEFVQKAFREGRSWAVWTTANWLSVLLLVIAGVGGVRLLLDPSPFFYGDPYKPAASRGQLWVFVGACALLALRGMVLRRSSPATERRDSESLAAKDRGAD